MNRATSLALLFILLLVAALPVSAQNGDSPPSDATTPEFGELLAAVLFLAGITERLVEVVKTALEERTGRDVPTWGTLLVGLAFGVAIAFASQVNLLAPLAVFARTPYVVQITLTGLVIGGGSSWANVVFELLFTRAKAPGTVTTTARLETTGGAASGAMSVRQPVE